jgi:hypothetical protein
VTSHQLLTRLGYVDDGEVFVVSEGAPRHI